MKDVICHWITLWQQIALVIVIIKIEPLQKLHQHSFAAISTFGDGDEVYVPRDVISVPLCPCIE
jgi:hypothetical protein